MKYSVEQIQQNLRDIFSILRQYDWLVDSYMLVSNETHPFGANIEDFQSIF